MRIVRLLTRDRLAMLAALAGPLAAAAVLVPFRTSWPNTNVALLLVVVIVAVAAIGSRLAGAIAAVWPAICFDLFFTLPYESQLAARARGKLLGSPARLEPDGTILTRHGRWDADQFGLPAGEIELRTFAGGQYYGRYMLTPKLGSGPSLQARLVAVTLAEIAGRALAGSTTASS